MPRRTGARPPIAPLASLALASSMLIALSALAPGGAAAKRVTADGSAEATPAQTTGAATPASETSSSTRAAEHAARRAEREAARSEARTEGSASSTGAASSPTPARGVHVRDAARRSERRAEREARKHGEGQAAASKASGRAGAAAQAPATVKAQKTHTEREREHERAREQRRREREAKGGRLRESRKEREAREAEEAAEGGPAIGVTGAGRSAVAAVGVSNLAGGAPTAQSPSAAAVASSRTGRAAHSRQRARRGSRPGTSTGPATVATALGLATAATGANGTNATTGNAKHAKPKGGARQRESPLVTTVTRIIGVIPTALWLLIGTLALAAMAFAVTSRMAARRARRLDRQRKELLEDVGVLQAALLPELPARVGPVATTAAYRPASGPGAGGDFYDVFALPEGLLAVIVGDVSGHGREALPHTTLLRYTLRAYLEAGLSPREALRAAAPALERQLGGSFATVVLASYDPRARLLTYSAAGHPHPILTGLDPDAAIIAASAPPIGAGSPTGTRQTVVSVPGAATALFYTDGVTEARTGGELYGQRRLATALGSLRAGAGAGAPAAAGEPTAAAVLDRVAEQTDRRPDDMAATVLNVAGGEQAPRIVSEELVLDGREADGKRALRFLTSAGLTEPEMARAVAQARATAAQSGSAVLKIDLGGERPRVSVEHDNVAPLRVRALARTQEVAL